MLTWVIHVYHLGVAVPPMIEIKKGKVSRVERWIPKSQFGMHQLILSGSPFERGLASGKLSQDLLYRQEKVLTEKLQEFIPNRWVLEALKLFAIRWFWGIDAYFEPWTVEEMYGVSKSAPHEFDSYADGFTRQVAYHGLHEVSQLAVDQTGDDMGCTVAAVPLKNTWILGRNFDFEAGRIFDSEKVLKWVFPDQGYAFVSVIWAGMVGAVTGVNENGIYLSLNAAGSRDFRRFGTPSSLVVLKALQFSKTAAEAIEIIKSETMFITDIFVLLDGHSGKLYRIEKSPHHTEVLPLEGPSIVTNHLVGSRWANDAINLYRKNELTSNFRSARGEELLKSWSSFSQKAPQQTTIETEKWILNTLRDKGVHAGRKLSLGNRRAIDSLIAAHSVIYNAVDQIFFVSQGPGVSGPFSGFDLKASFSERSPKLVRTLSRDPEVSDQIFSNIKTAAKEISNAEKELKAGKCEVGYELIKSAEQKFSDSSGFYTALGNYYQCKGNLESARKEWRRALGLVPAYPRQVRYLEEKIK